MEPEVYAVMRQREDAFWWHVGMQKIIDSQLKKYAPAVKDNVILDAGCGTGGMFNTLSKYGNVYGSDQSPAAVEFAKEKNIAAEIATGSITELPFANNTFDMVVCLDVLYHAMVGSDNRALREFWRVLRPGGILIIREPAYNWLRGHHDQLVWAKRRYSKKELASKLTEVGFSLIKASYINFWLFPLALVKRLSENLYKPKNIISTTFRSQPIVNYVFKQFLFLEAKLINHLNFPWGLSVMCVARRK